MLIKKIEDDNELKRAWLTFLSGIMICAIVLAGSSLISRSFFLEPDVDFSGLVSCHDPESDFLVSDIFTGISKAIGAEFEPAEPENFPWYGEMADGLKNFYVVGQKMSARPLHYDQTVFARKFLEEKGFVSDRNNIAADSESNTNGFVSGRTACLLRDFVLNETGGQSCDNRALFIICGSLCNSSFSKIQNEHYLKKALADKYSRSSDDVFLDIISENEQRIKGEYRIYSQNEEWPVLFFAIKKRGGWEIVFDQALRPDCSSLAGAGFSEQEIEECHGRKNTEGWRH